MRAEATLPKATSTDSTQHNDIRSEIKEISAVPSDSIPAWQIAVRAAREKQAKDIRVLDLTGITSFTDYFVICSGTNIRQNQAIADEIGLQLKANGEMPSSIEGYEQGEWILADYGDFLIHVFSATAREYYSLERLWREAKTLELPPDEALPRE